LNFLDRFSKKFQTTDFMKIRSLGVELFHADGQAAWCTDMETEATNMIASSRNIGKAPQKLG
jgi:hypothetical protein